MRAENVRQCLLCTKVKKKSQFQGNKGICKACENVLNVKRRNPK
jgi:uncharacterized paraquat-inducible protein A